MRIEASSSSCSDVVPASFTALVERIKTAPTTSQFVEELDRARGMQSVLAKTELSRWADVLDRCDDVLAATTMIENHRMRVDFCAESKKSTSAILRFTAVLFECTSTRRIYASTDRLLALLESSDLSIVADVLRLLQTIGKRSKFLPTRLPPAEQTNLVEKLTAIAQCWGGRLRSVKMSDCLAEDNNIPNVFPFSYSDGKGNTASLEQRPDENESLLSIVDRICQNMDREHRYTVLSRLRMLRLFHLPDHRMHCLIIRLLSISTLIYCRCQPDESQINALVYPGFIDETAALLRIPLTRHAFVDMIQAEALRTLTSVVSLEKAPKVAEILDSLGANSYHGFIAVFTRMLVEDIKNGDLGKPGKPSIVLGTALFSFIYHISNIESGGEKLMSCGLARTLLSLIEHKEVSLELISFATRCSRIIDTFTTLDVSAFRHLKGMNMFVDRLVHEIDECRKDQPFVIDTSGDTDEETYKFIPVKTPVVEKRCHQMRTGLIKGLLTFIKRVINVPEMQDSVRTIMEGSLPDALMHIISNAEYYSDSIYHHTLQLITNFIYQEPAQLTQLQKRHVPYVMLQSMLRKELPNSRDVIGNLGNVFTALCLNEQGLKQFKAYKPFEHVFKIVMSIKFLATLKKKRSDMNDAATTIGAALDDLLRHQPTLKPLMLEAVIEALEKLNTIAKEPPPNTKIVMALSKVASKAAYQNFSSNSGGNSPMAEQIPQEEDMVFSPRDDDISDEDDDADLSMDEVSSVRQATVDKMGLEMDCPSELNDGSRVLPLGDYLLIFTKIFEAVVTQAQASDLIEGFVEKDGIEKLLALSQVKPISHELANSNFGQSVAAIIQYVLQHKPAGERLMGALDGLFSQHASALPAADDCTGGSYFAKLDVNVLTDAISFINGTLPILVSLSKVPYGGSQYSAERRGRVNDAWLTPTGKNFHKNIRRTARLLGWDSTVIKVIEDSKTAAGSQTDPLEKDELDKMEQMGELTSVEAVAVDPPKGVKTPWEAAGISREVVRFWIVNRSLAEALQKANKQVCEFVGLISRTCYAPQRRQRRYEYQTYAHPKTTSKMADEIFSVIYADLKYVPSWGQHSPMEFGRISEVLNQLGGVLFDDRRQPYHAMLDKFYSSGCHQAFCDILSEKLAPALEGPNCSQLDLAFSDWFKLAERLANRNKMIHTTYRQTATGLFDPEKYLRLVHSDFFRVLSVLFAKLSDASVNLRNYQSLCEEAIAVYKEVAENLVPIDESEKTPPLVNDNQDEKIRSLVEMGFDREEVVIALNTTTNIADATELLIARQQQQQPAFDALVQAAQEHGIFVDVARNEENEDGRMSAGSDENGDAAAAASSAAPDGVAAPIITPLRELTIDKDVSISQACIDLMPLCKRLLEFGSELVFSCADLFIGVIGSLDNDWKKNDLIRTIMLSEVIDMIKKLLGQQEPEGELAVVLATRIHFACLLFEHVSDDYLQSCQDQPMVSTMLMLMAYIYNHFDAEHMNEKLLPPTVLWLDLYEKTSRAIKRRDLVLKLVPNKNLKWYHLGEEHDNRYGNRQSKKWTLYTTDCQVKLNKAFFEGKTKVVVKKMRERIYRREKDVTIDFAQLSEKDNEIHRHSVNMVLPEMESINVTAKDILDSEKTSVWTDAEKNDLLVQVVRLLHKEQIHHTAAHSLLSFVARLTRDPINAEQFLRDGGIAAIIRLRSTSTPCSATLTSLILRQCVDCDEFTRGIFEKSVRQCTASNSAPLEFLGISSDSRPKEWHDILNKLTPLAVRQPEIYVDVMEKNVKMVAGTGNLSENICAQYVGKTTRTISDNTVNMNSIVTLLLEEVLNGNWDTNLPEVHERMLTRGNLLNLLSELVKTYNVTANLVTDAKDNNQSILFSLLEKYIGHEDKETLRSLKVLIAVLSTCNHSPKAQESLVNDVKASLLSICDATSEPTVICAKLSEICSLITHMAETPHHSHSRPGHATPVNPILKLFHKKKVCNDLVRAITFLRFSAKEAVETTAEILKTLETLMRYMNMGAQPALVPDANAAGMNRRYQGLLSLEELFGENMGGEEGRRRLDVNAIFRGGNEPDLEAVERSIAVLRQQARSIDRVMERVAAPMLGDEVIHHHHHEQEDDDEDAEDSENSISEDEQDHPEGDSADEEEEEAHDEAENADNDEGNQDSIGEEDEDDHNETGMDIGGDTEEETPEENNEEETEEDDDDDDDDADEDDDDGEDYENDHTYERDVAIQDFYGDMDRPPAMIMDGLMDDWDMFPTVASRLSRHRQRPQNTSSTHPLLVRPHPVVDVNPPSHVFTVPVALQFDYHHIVSGGLPLTRQNAIRRLGGSSRSRPLEPRRMIFDRLFDMQDGRGMIHSGIGSNRDVEDQRLRASIPSALERITEGADILEPVSIRFLGLLINAIVTAAAETVLKAERAARAEKAMQKAKEEAAASGAAETATVVAPPEAELARPAWEGDLTPDGRMPAPPPSYRQEVRQEEQRDEAMDVTEQNAMQEEASDAPPPSSAATVASSLPEDEDLLAQMDDNTSPPESNAPNANDEDVPMDTSELPPAADEPAVEQQSAPTEQAEQEAAAPAEAEAPAVPVNEIPEEFRAILGDIAIPDGVDPAFLAALPEDMRAEVIRDHERQQRAQRAAAAVPAAPAAGGAAPAVPVVEPLDQDFLNALPPELQEEILAQHERAVREAEEAIRRANEPAPPAQQEMDGAAVIASLSPSERQQVLAEMDDTELQRLPQNMQDEARRARANMRDLLEPVRGLRNVMRIHNLYVRRDGGRGVRVAGGGAAQGQLQGEAARLGLSAGRTQTASTQAVQLVDRESIIILCGLFLMDNRLTVARLQKVIRLICSHAPSCDFVIWCLQGFLNKASEGTIEDEEIVSVCPEWLDSVNVPGGGHNERSVKISKGASSVFVHPVISGNVCRNVLEAMHTLARTYPGHFIPTALRTEQLECKQWPARDTFWQLLQNPSGKALGKEPVDSRPAVEQFVTSPLAHLVHYFEKPLFKENSALQDKLFKVLNAVVQTLPDDTISRLGLNSQSKPMEEEMKILVEVLSKGTCGGDGFVDGRSVLMELMRVLSPEISNIVYDKLCESIVSIGLQLQPQIESLMTEMGDATDSGEDSPQPSTSGEKGRIKSARLAGDSVVVDGDALSKLKMSMYVCREMRLPAMMALTDKSGAQYNLLNSLQTLTKLRDTMRARKEKKIEDEKKKAEEAARAAAAVAAAPSNETEPAAEENAEQQQPQQEEDQPMQQDQQPAAEAAPEPSSSGASVATAKEPEVPSEPVELINVELAESRLSERLSALEGLWSVVSTCLLRLGKASDPHAVLALHPAAEAFFLVHSVPKASTTDHEHPDNVRMIEFAEKHREVLNQVLRQNGQALSSGGPFSFLTQFPKLLDFDVKRKFFRKELTRIDGEQGYRRADVNVQVRRSHLFSDSFRELYRLRPAEWKKRFYIVFQGEEGQDAGGLLREWFSVITREIFNPNYALFITAPGDMVTYMINKASYINPEHLDYFKFVGRLIAKAIYDNKLLDCYFTRAFYKHILNVPVRYQDIESEDPAFFKSLEFLLENPINDLGLDLTFSLEVEEFGVRSIRDLKPDGRKIEVTDENKHEYVNLVCQMKMTGSIQKQLDAFLTGFYEVIPKNLITMFNEQEMELLISGLPDVDIDDLANNTEYKSYTKTSPQIQWFWRALRTFEAEDRAKFLQFVTGTSKVPLQGFASLEGMNGVQKFSIHMDSRGGDRLPAAHTCFNQLDLPLYETYEKLRDCLLVAIRECTEGFGFA